jgi:tRNA A37 threonylcarbamoyltransferase TsaD
MSLKPFALQQALRQANMAAQDVDGIAFTRGPGVLDHDVNTEATNNSFG